MKCLLLFACGALAVACAGDARTPSLSGTLRLVPHEAVATLPPASQSYGDRRYREAAPVDYSRPGFAVVYLADGPPPSDTASLELRDSGRGPHLAPTLSVAGLKGKIRISNTSAEARVVASPEANWLERIPAGGMAEFHPRRSGAHTIMLLGATGPPASIFVAPGPFSVVSPRGHWQLFDVSPGTRSLQTWHSRFPSTQKTVTVARDKEAWLDLVVSTRAAAEDPK